MSIDEKMKSLGLKLPPPSPSVGAFVSHVRSGNLLFLSGQIAKRDGKSWVGKLGEDLTTSEGKQAARSVAVDLLGTLRAAVGDLNRIRIVKLRVLVNSAPSFTEQHLVANGASELFLELLGDKGAHARCAYGVAQLPLGSCVEIELTAEI
jgi:enamine deaminase RidA (YjgF/YER057c/UK114 family)